MQSGVGTMWVFPRLPWAKDAGFCTWNGNILCDWFERLIISLTSDVLLIESFTSFSVKVPGHWGYSQVLLLCWFCFTNIIAQAAVKARDLRVLKESREALVWRASWLRNIPLQWGLLVVLVCHWTLHHELHMCICIYVSYLWKTEMFIYKYGALIFVKHFFSICWNRKLASSIL